MILVVVGPTGVGKTKLSLALAHYFDCEIINGDSMQVYQEMEIGTAKIKSNEMEGIVHHLLSYRSPMQNYSVEVFQRDVRTILDQKIKNHESVVMVGGTGLYLKAALYDYQFEAQQTVDLTEFEKMDEQALFEYVQSIDPEDAKKLHPNNRQRLLRAISIYLGTGHNKTWHLSKQNKQPLYPHIMIGLTMDRQMLYQRIDQRVDTMIEDGLEEEVKRLMNKYDLEGTTAIKGIGYQEFYRYFNDEYDKATCIDLIKKNSRHYAKRQYTWFKNQMDVKWFNVEVDDFNQTILSVIDYIKEVHHD